jgi:hypothetical protein
MYSHLLYTCSLSYAVCSIVACSSIISVLILSSLSLSLSSFAFIGRNRAWKCPKCLPDGDVLVRSFHLLYLFIIFSEAISISSSFECLFIDVSRYLNHSPSVMSIGSLIPSSSCSTLSVSAPNPIFRITSGVASGVVSACLKFHIFRFNIKFSIVGPSVIAKYSSSVPSFDNGTRIDDTLLRLIVLLTSYLRCLLL